MSNDIVGTEMRGWKVGPAVTVRYKGGSRTLHVCTRTCRECRTEMRMNAARSALEGRAKNNGLDYARCRDCRTGRRRPAAEPVAAPIADQPQDLVSQLYRDNVALIRENAELKAAAKFSLPDKYVLDSPTLTGTLVPKFAVAPSPQPAAAPLADTAELESLRKLRAYVEQRWFQQEESSPSVDDMIEELDEARDQQLRWRRHYAAEVAKSLAAKGFGVG